jgi:acetyl-CoA carboxylase biotin carboxyl carrier protein
MDIKEIKELIALISKSQIAEFKYRKDDFEITIRTDDYHKGKTMVAAPAVMSAPMAVSQSPAPAPAAPAPIAAPAAAVEAPVASNLVEIRSPIVGTFYRSSGPDKPVFAKVGDRVEVGQKVCIVEAMKLFNEIESEVSGLIVKVIVEDASPVEYDTVLFLVDPKG